MCESEDDPNNSGSEDRTKAPPAAESGRAVLPRERYREARRTVRAARRLAERLQAESYDAGLGFGVRC